MTSTVLPEVVFYGFIPGVVIGLYIGAFFMRVKLEEEFGRLLADICEADAGLVPSDYPKADVDREWEQIMRDQGRLS